MARDVGLPVATLEDFSAGKIAEFDAALDLLKSTNRAPPIPLAPARPPPFQPSPLPYKHAERPDWPAPWPMRKL